MTRQQEWISIPMTVDVPYRFAAGRYLTKALTELRDNGRIFAVECPRCKRIQLPPRIVCAPCHVKNGRWVELPLEGTLVAFTIMYLPLTDPTTGKPHEPPFVYGSVRLDGCDSVLDHLIHAEPDRDKVWVGMRCRIVLRPRGERVGDLSDILYFEPLTGQVKPGTENRP
ncbi:MAG: Zn-ribbon domain-containing OB-fold protein [Syntrophales bacterium]|nr:Zn-ribbon domain-containing OB-fold protein [Syntrophales bacterium]